MKDWIDFNNDGEIDSMESVFFNEMLCSSREEHEALFGDVGGFLEDVDKEDEDLLFAGLDRDELELMEPDERREAFEDAGLDPDDYDFD